jgi:hypothetical protein
MVGREPDAGFVLLQITQAKRLGVLDENPEDALALRLVTNGGSYVVAHTDRHELAEPCVPGIQDAEGSISRPDEADSLLDEAVQNLRELQVLLDEKDGLNQRL